MIIFSHEQVLAANDDVFLEGHDIKPYLLEELTQPTEDIPQAPQVSTTEIRRPATVENCMVGTFGAVLMVAGCLTVYWFAIAGLMRVGEWVISRCR